jgi:hypothetical protein
MNRYLTSFVAALALLTVLPANATCFLRQSTASQNLTLPTFVDSTDGDTAETGLTIANTDIKLTKGFAATTQTNKNSGGATHIATGDYYATFDATDTDTVGPLKIKVKVSGALAVWMDCVVLEEATYDLLFASSALGYVANAPVSVAQFGGTNGVFSGGRPEVNVSHFGGTAGTFASGRPETNTSHWGGTAVATARPLVDAVQISGDSGAADLLETAFDGTAGAVASMGIVDQGTAQSATSTTLVLRSALAMGDDTANGMTLVACGSTQGYCQSRLVTDYVLSTDTATVTAWSVTPSGTITYYLFASAPGEGGGGPTAAQIVDEWETQSQADPTGFHVNVREFNGTAVTARDIGASVLLSSGTGTGQLSISSGLLSWNPAWDAEVESEVDDSIGAGTGTSLTAIPWNAAWDAEVESEVDDSIGGGTGTALTSIPWNASWDAEVQSEANDALVANFLDQLIASSYDSASPPGNAASLLREMTENDGGLTRFTANALEQGPSGGGGGTNITQIEGVDATDQIDARVTAMLSAYDPPTRTEATSDKNEVLTRLGTPAGASISVDIADLPTNAELAASQAAADDATIAAIAALNNVSLTQIRDMVIEDQGGGKGLGCSSALMLAVLTGRATVSGNTVTYRDPSNGEVRVVVTHDAVGNRSSVTTTCPSY